MVKIRYSELPAGLHVSAESHGRHTVIYLQPGLTAAQRRAALIRVRSGARMGHGPRLPAASMVLAVGADRLRTTVRNGAAAMRGHPLLLLPPLIMLVSSAIVFVLMSFVTLTVPQHDRAGAAPQLSVPANPAAHHGRTDYGRTGRPAANPGSSDPDRLPSGTGGKAGPGPTGSATPSPASGSQSPVPVLSGSPPTASPSPTAAPSPDPAPSPSASGSGTCLRIGPLGLCLNL